MYKLFGNHGNIRKQAGGPDMEWHVDASQLRHISSLKTWNNKEHDSAVVWFLFDFYLFRNSLFFWPCVPSLTQQGLITLLSLPAWHQHRAPQHTLTPHDITAPCAPTISGSGQAYKSLSTVFRQLSVIWKLWPLWPSFPLRMLWLAATSHRSQ